MRAKFPSELREELLGKTQWGEREFEALCLGVPPREYCDRDEIAPQAEREAARREILGAIRRGRIFAEETGEGNSLYGGQWNLDPVSAVRWAIGSDMFPRFPDWLKAGKLKEIYQRQDAERLRAGRYTLLQAADEIANNTGEQPFAILEILKNAVRRDALVVHLPGSNTPYQSNEVRGFYEEAYWDDLNTCLAEFLPRLGWRFPEPGGRVGVVAGGDKGKPKSADRVAEDASAAPIARSESWNPSEHAARVTRTSNSTRRDILAPVIDKAIEQASGERYTSAVWVRLKELALESHPPFSGEADAKGLTYTDVNNKVQTFTREALGKRLKRMAEPK